MTIPNPSEIDTIDDKIEKSMEKIYAEIEGKRAKYNEAVKAIADRMSYPEPTGVSTSLAKFIMNNMIQDECPSYIVYGARRYGKSSYSLKTLAVLLGTWDWNILKRFIVYKPEEFIELRDYAKRKHRKYPTFVWDDAGIWLNAYSWNETLIRKISNYLDAIGTDFNSMIFTSPLPSHIVRAVRKFPSSINICIYKINQNAQKMRSATGYDEYVLPDGKTRVKKKIFDIFSAILPTKFYDFYAPYRQGYADETYEKVATQLYAEANSKIPEKPNTNLNPRVSQINETVPSLLPEQESLTEV